MFSATRQLLVSGPFPGWARVSDSEKPQACFLENISPAGKQALDGHPLLKALPLHGGDRGPDMTCWESDPSVAEPQRSKELGAGGTARDG